MRRLADHTWPELEPRGDAVLAVPLGSTEQHGPHLPLDTDTRIAVALAERLAAEVPAVVVAPALPYGASGEHRGFPGTVSLGNEALETLLVELVRSASDTFPRTVLVNAHGGNAMALQRAVNRLEREDRQVLAWAPRHGDPRDTHAGRAETSLMLVLAPSTVQTADMSPGNTEPLPDLLETIRAGSVRDVSPNGVLGDPTDAEAEQGRLLLDRLAADLVTDVRRWLA